MAKPKINPKSFPATVFLLRLAWLVRVELLDRRGADGACRPPGLRNFGPKRSEPALDLGVNRAPVRRLRRGYSGDASGRPPGKPAHHTVSCRTFL